MLLKQSALEYNVSLLKNSLAEKGVAFFKVKKAVKPKVAFKNGCGGRLVTKKIL